MKMIFLLLLMALGVIGVNAQKEIIYGIVETDGYEKISKGAFWAQRPEAKMVYDGKFPGGVDVFTLDQEYFVRFAEGENNPLDINYIVFPKGAVVYSKNGTFYAALCGNRIRYIRPVSCVQVKTEPNKKDKDDVTDDFGVYVPPKKNTSKVIVDDTFINDDAINLNLPNKKQGKKFKAWWIIVPLTAILAGTTAYLLLKKHGSSAPADTGRPWKPPLTE